MLGLLNGLLLLQRDQTMPELSEDWEMVARSDEDFDLVSGGLVVELSRGSETVRWTFWAVRFQGSEERIGGIDCTMSPRVIEMLEKKRRLLLAAAPTEGDGK